MAAVGLLTANAAQEEPAKQDLEKLQGTWTLISAMQNGKALVQDKVKRTTIVFKNDRFLFPASSDQATSKDGTIKIDPSTKPKQMDATSTQGEIMLGIYHIDGDDYKVCFAPPGKERPTEFGSKPGSGYIYQIWVRKKV